MISLEIAWSEIFRSIKWSDRPGFRRMTKRDRALPKRGGHCVPVKRVFAHNSSFSV